MPFSWKRYAHKSIFSSKQILSKDSLGKITSTQEQVCWVTDKEAYEITLVDKQLSSRGIGCFTKNDSTWVFEQMLGRGSFRLNKESVPVVLSSGESLIFSGSMIQLGSTVRSSELFSDLHKIRIEQKTIQSRDLVKDLYNGRFISQLVVYLLVVVGLGVVSE